MQNTVLVLGAGASAPYQFPTGSQLKDIISERSVGSDVLRDLNVDPAEYHAFRTTLLRAGRTSVDAFLETRRDLLSIGKLAIALTLLPYEKMATLFDQWPTSRLHPEQKPAGQKGEHWYELLFNMLTGGRQFTDVDFTKLSIITFNYDRSLEHYFYSAITNSYNASPEEVAAKLDAMSIVHVHGSLGRLPWQRETRMPAVPYGDHSAFSVSYAATTIKVLHETEMSSTEFERARGLISHAKCVYFLGFGFHHSNLQRLGAEQLTPREFVGGTAVNLSRDTIVKAAPLKLFGHNRLPKAPPFQKKDIYDYLYHNVSFSD